MHSLSQFRLRPARMKRVRKTKMTQFVAKTHRVGEARLAHHVKTICLKNLRRRLPCLCCMTCPFEKILVDYNPVFVDLFRKAREDPRYKKQRKRVGEQHRRNEQWEKA